MTAIVAAMGESSEALDQVVRDFITIDGGILTVSTTATLLLPSHE